ncbi:hypothetical protein MycrhN_2558 [Mycolicibacterium rhodesiae NBB3]|uniref:Uncharacterized protein n=1 Tax=Mycolicibacterium rhodesiae (strain NBB3) TaxID=710685 RepID=G8RX95_MYCRN|nr:hypothetical protein [Mycolicibacterium rhodesiae]AEV73143.1 hypothetical protein MycrhN_2558 [Mycolicibacterium rhodesiae NBB3]
MGMADEIRPGLRRERDADAAARNSREMVFREFTQAIDAIAPEVAQACRELGIRRRGRIGLTRFWEFHGEYGSGPIGVTSSGRWFFYGNEGKRSHRKVMDDWRPPPNRIDPTYLREFFKRQVARLSG